MCSPNQSQYNPSFCHHSTISQKMTRMLFTAWRNDPNPHLNFVVTDQERQRACLQHLTATGSSLMSFSDTCFIALQCFFVFQFTEKLFPVACYKCCRKGWDAGERLFTKLQGISCCPAGHPHGHDQQHGAWSPWGAWAWVPHNIWWLPCPRCWGITTGRSFGLGLCRANKCNHHFFIYWKNLPGFSWE